MCLVHEERPRGRHVTDDSTARPAPMPLLPSVLRARAAAGLCNCRSFARPRFCAALASNQLDSMRSSPRLTGDEHTLWVSYADTSTIRRQLVGLAQQVRARVGCDPLPEIVLPGNNRVRHGFWFMRFRETTHRATALASLHGAPFATSCGSLEGELQLDEGTRALDLRAMLNLPRREPDPIHEWLQNRFGVHGTITSIELPRVRNNWDAGLAFIRFAEAQAAEAALEALDGTPSPVSGCNMYLDFAIARPLRVLAPNPADAGYARPPRLPYPMPARAALEEP